MVGWGGRENGEKGLERRGERERFIINISYYES